METELILSVGGFPPLSARGCKQELIPVPQGNLRRTINGELVMVGGQDLKYKSTVKCDDKTAFATDGLYPGCEVMLGCVQRLWQKVKEAPENTPITLERYPVKGSVVVMDENQKQIAIREMDGKKIQLEDRAQTYYISYRPWLNMRTVTYSLNTDEWGIKGGWSLEMEEI
ncbi:MAG: hypothetical protein K2W94_06090 [Alphaproteobacteria bacterium]|nr:hypothetical protein [Alphaproteobacteria bacterium]